MTTGALLLAAVLVQCLAAAVPLAIVFTVSAGRPDGKAATL